MTEAGAFAKKSRGKLLRKEKAVQGFWHMTYAKRAKPLILS